MYHPYGYNPAGEGSAFSCFGPNGNIPACIGFDGNDASSVNLFEKDGMLQIRDDDIVVNPTGLFCDWTQGTVESFLESAWVSSVIRGSDIDWKQYVVNFYYEFYGRTLTEADWLAINPEGD